MSPPLAAHLGVWAEAEGWSRMPQRRRLTPKATSMEPSPPTEGCQITISQLPLTMARSATSRVTSKPVLLSSSSISLQSISCLQFSIVYGSILSRSTFSWHTIIRRTWYLLGELFWGLRWCVICWGILFFKWHCFLLHWMTDSFFMPGFVHKNRCL